MNQEERLQQEAKEYASDVHVNFYKLDDITTEEVQKLVQADFIAGATSEYVEIEKINFALRQLAKVGLIHPNQKYEEVKSYLEAKLGVLTRMIATIYEKEDSYFLKYKGVEYKINKEDSDGLTRIDIDRSVEFIINGNEAKITHKYPKSHGLDWLSNSSEYPEDYYGY